MVTNGDPMPIPVADARSTVAARKRSGGTSCADRGTRFHGTATEPMTAAAVRTEPATAKSGPVQRQGRNRHDHAEGRGDEERKYTAQPVVAHERAVGNVGDAHIATR